jgi:hypothetical protein
LQENGGWSYPQPSNEAVTTLLAFERLLQQQALPGKPIDPW